MGSTTARTGVQFPVVADSSLLLSIQASSVAYLVSYSLSSGGSFAMGEAAGPWNWPLTSDQCWGFYCLPLCATTSDLDLMQTSLPLNTFTHIQKSQGEKTAVTCVCDCTWTQLPCSSAKCHSVSHPLYRILILSDKVYYFRPLLCHTCGQLVQWAMSIWQMSW
jgi:hypothetical protein